jgi:hypothetical protein
MRSFESNFVPSRRVPLHGLKTTPRRLSGTAPGRCGRAQIGEQPTDGRSVVRVGVAPPLRSSVSGSTEVVVGAVPTLVAGNSFLSPIIIWLVCWN